MSIEINEQGIRADFESSLPPADKYCPQGQRVREYLDHEKAKAVAERSEEVVAFIGRFEAFCKAYNLTGVIKDLPVKKASLSKALKDLNDEEKAEVTKLIAELAAKKESDDETKEGE